MNSNNKRQSQVETPLNLKKQKKSFDDIFTPNNHALLMHALRLYLFDSVDVIKYDPEIVVKGYFNNFIKTYAHVSYIPEYINSTKCYGTAIFNKESDDIDIIMVVVQAKESIWVNRQISLNFKSPITDVMKYIGLFG